MPRPCPVFELIGSCPAESTTKAKAERRAWEREAKRLVKELIEAAEDVFPKPGKSLRTCRNKLYWHLGIGGRGRA